MLKLTQYKMRFHSVFFLFFLILTTFFSCSLNYLNGENTESSVPEFIFRNASYSKYEDNKKTTVFSAATVEQYKDNGSTYAQDATFQTFNSDGEKETEGKCDLLSANIEDKLYTLFGNIDVKLVGQKTRILAENLKFDQSSEQITSSQDGKVSVIKDNLSISGTGFSASMISRNFYFSDEVSGKIISEEE